MRLPPENFFNIRQKNILFNRNNIYLHKGINNKLNREVKQWQTTKQ
jgi:hypothetical protein